MLITLKVADEMDKFCGRPNPPFVVVGDRIFASERGGPPAGRFRQHVCPQQFQARAQGQATGPD